MIADQVLDAIVKVKRLSRDTISLDSTLEELGVDSLDVIELTFELEQNLSTDLPDPPQDLRMRSLREFIQLLENLLQTSTK